MTLIVAVPTPDGVVLASDGQVTSGQVRSTGDKLYRLNSHCAWGGAGEVALIQRVGEAIAGISVDQPLLVLRDQLANAIKQCVNSLLQLDFRTPFFQGNPEALLSLHPGDFIFAEHRDSPKMLHITAYGTPEWILRPYAIGNGAPFAYALLEKYQERTLTMEQASVLTCKVIEEAIDVGAYSLGAILIAVVCTDSRGPGRYYREPRDTDYVAVRKAGLELQRLVEADKSLVPVESLPQKGTLGFRIQNP